MHVFVFWRCQDREDLIILERSLENSSFSCTTLILLEDRLDIWIMLSWNNVVIIHIYTSTPTLLSPSLDPAILDQEESCPDPPPPPEQWWSDGVGRAGTVLLLIVRMWLTLGPVLSLYWEQEQGQDHTNTAQSLLIMRLITSAVQCSIGSTTVSTIT